MTRPIVDAPGLTGDRDTAAPAMGKASMRVLFGLVVFSGAALFPAGASARERSSIDDFSASLTVGPEIIKGWESPAIVRIVCPDANTTGTAFKHKSGRLLTSSNAVGSCSEVQVVLPTGNRITATVTAREPHSGLAIITASQPIDGRPLIFADRPVLQIGTPTASWGFPTSYESAIPLVSIGYIAGFKQLQVDKDRVVTKLIVGASFNAGLSGSPLVNQSGAVVGMISGTPSPLSDTALSALKALREERGSGFVWQKADGAGIPLSHGQVVWMVLEEMQAQMTYAVGVATPLEELQDFLAKSDVDLLRDASGPR